MHTFFLQVCRSAAAFDILLPSWGSSAGKLEWFITVLFKWCISFSYVDWQERDCSNPEILFPSPSPSPSQMTSPTETSSGVHIGSCHCDCIQCTNYLFEGVLKVINGECVVVAITFYRVSKMFGGRGEVFRNCTAWSALRLFGECCWLHFAN